MTKRGIAIMAAMAITGIATASVGSSAPEDDKAIIGRSEIKIEGGLMTPEALWAMGRIGEYSVSPDAKKIIYGISYYSVEHNKSHHTLNIMDTDGNSTPLTTTAANESSAAWIKGGTKIAFLSNESGKSQVWEMNPDGTERKQLTNDESDIEGFLFSPDGTKVVLIKRVKIKPTTADIYPDLPQAQGFVVNDLMYKHWDEWITDAPHPFIASFDGESIDAGTDLLEGTVYDCPNRPFGGAEQLAWSNDSKKLAYACIKKSGAEYTVSTDTDIYLYDLENGTTENLCKIDEERSSYGYDTAPKFSPDGKKIAWLSMEHDGYESDQNRLSIMDLATRERVYLTGVADNNGITEFDSNVDSYCWAHNSKSLYFTGTWHGTTQVYNITLKGKLTCLTEGDHDYNSVAILGNKHLIMSRVSMSAPADLYKMEAKAGAEVTQLTQENKHIFDQIATGKVEARWCKTVDGKDLHSWVVYPPNFDPTKKYPTLLFCEGGPQSPVSQFWSYRWNFQIMAANGYIIIAPNRRGLPGFGLEWNKEISTNYGGNCMSDLLTAIDDIATEPYVDTDRLGCVGASFGGYSAMWLAGHHEKRFKAFIAHDGFFNMEQQYYETEESWFTNWDLGGAPYEQTEEVRRSYANSPHRFVDKWDTPILLIHGDRDYRILSSQSMAAFNAARLKGIPAQLLLFPDENHWVLKPQNGILWQRTFFAWLEKWLKQ